MSTPIYLRDVVIEIGTTAVSFARSIEISEEREVTEEKTFSGIIRGVGFSKVSFSIEYFYVNDQILQLIKSEQPQTVKIYPQGKGTGKPVITINNAIFSSNSLAMEPESFIAISVEGVADSYTTGTQS